MLIERREFLQTTIGAVSGLAMPSFSQATVNVMNDTRPDWLMTYEQTFAASNDRELFGVPKSWSCVRDGLHPFSPDRTLILPVHDHADDHQTKLSRQIVDRWELDSPLPNMATILCIVQAASVLTQFYGVWERAEDWARRLLVWLFVFYNSVAQDHHWLAPCSWQGFSEEAKTSNGIVDWWLILIPQGIEVPSIDGTRLHTLITPIYNEVGKPRLPVEFWDFMARAIGCQPQFSGEPQFIDATWLDISRMDRKSACLSVNQRIARNLTQTV